jgi:hypothetical protein
MKKSILILALCFVLMFAVAAVSADETAGHKVTYLPNNCLAEVPTDENTYAGGETVQVLFEPVKYKDYLIFYGWDIDDDGVADFGYNYDKFPMPDFDVELKAICVGASWGPSCPGCHLHGIPRSWKLEDYTPVTFGPYTSR